MSALSSESPQSWTSLDSQLIHLCSSLYSLSYLPPGCFIPHETRTATCLSVPTFQNNLHLLPHLNFLNLFPHMFLFCALGSCSSTCGEWTNSNRKFLKVQNLRSHTKSTESESFFKQDLQQHFIHLWIWEAYPREPPPPSHGEGENTLFTLNEVFTHCKLNAQSNPGFPLTQVFLKTCLSPPFHKECLYFSVSKKEGLAFFPICVFF